MYFKQASGRQCMRVMHNVVQHPYSDADAYDAVTRLLCRLSDCCCAWHWCTTALQVKHAHGHTPHPTIHKNSIHIIHFTVCSIMSWTHTSQIVQCLAVAPLFWELRCCGHVCQQTFPMTYHSRRCCILRVQHIMLADCHTQGATASEVNRKIEYSKYDTPEEKAAPKSANLRTSWESTTTLPSTAAAKSVPSICTHACRICRPDQMTSQASETTRLARLPILRAFVFRVLLCNTVLLVVLVLALPVDAAGTEEDHIMQTSWVASLLPLLLLLLLMVTGAEVAVLDVAVPLSLSCAVSIPAEPLLLLSSSSVRLGPDTVLISGPSSSCSCCRCSCSNSNWDASCCSTSPARLTAAPCLLSAPLELAL